MKKQDQYDLRILRSLRRITRSIALHSRRLSAESSITSPQLVCLRTVIEKGPLTATAISREIHVSPSTIVGVLDRLEDKGLVLRERSKEDRRIVFVSATESGRELAQNTPSPLQQKLSEALKQLPESEQLQITLSLERVMALIDADAELEADQSKSSLLDIPAGTVPPESGLVV
ncbi:MAG TPA: MarR family transcriptional regulator [Alcaligenaceae bacterium]|nr:MarR family transcriptional regulator [Alcaligenaceae bacterium]